MSTTRTASQSREARHAAKHSLSHVKRYLRLIFIRGPKQLLTARISAKCAALMALMCAPSLLFCSILTIPAIIFTSPYQNAYFHFSGALEQDPSRWLVLVLTGICTILSLAVPATMEPPVETDIH